MLIIVSRPLIAPDMTQKMRVFMPEDESFNLLES